MNIYKKIRIPVILLIVGYVFICVFMFIFQTTFLFFPFKENVTLPVHKNISEVSLITSDNVTLNGWFINNQGDKTVLFFHGNGGNIATNQERIKIFGELNLNALMIDYRGYGKSQGKILHEKDIYEDASTAYKYLVEKMRIPPSDIIIWGQSLGGGVAAHTAQNKPIFATVLESTFVSMEKVAHEQFPWLPIQLLLRFHFQTDKKLQNIISPILIIHSRNDDGMYFSHGERLFQIANDPKTFLATHGSHNGGFMESYPLYVDALKKILSQ